MPLDPQVQAILTAVKAAGLPELWQLTPEQARFQYKTRVQRLDVRDEPIHRVEDRTIPGPVRPIPLRIYQPRAARPDESLPALVWFHGGGFVIGDLDTHDSTCRRLAKEGDCLVVAVDYRLAPESKFPAAVEDSLAATRWVLEHGREIGADVRRVAVGGDSAGANLATVAALLARDQGLPPLAYQLLIYPCVAPEPETRSHKLFAEGHLLTRKTITWFFGQYLRTSRDAQDFRYAPLVADDLAGLPPAFVLVAGYDPLRDEGVQYANRLVEAGIDVTLVNMSGMIHGFYVMLGAVDAASDAIRQSGVALRRAFGTS